MASSGAALLAGRFASLLGAQSGRLASVQLGALVGQLAVAADAASTTGCRSLSTLIQRGSGVASCSGSERWLDASVRRGIHTSTATAASDYYELLGLQRSATEQEIKKAYYALAKKYHPDTNKGDPAAAARFQELQKAYEVLRDPEKRKLYDTVGREGMDRMDSAGGAGGPGGGPDGFEGFQGFGFGFGGGGGGGGFPFGNAADIFENLFRADPRLQAMLNRVQMQPLRISFMEAVNGTRKSVQIGVRQGATKTVDLDIPAGVDTGDVLETQVELPTPGRRTASAKMTVSFPIEVMPHPKFRRQGSDIFASLELPLSQALLGATVRVDTLDGGVELIVPPLTQQGDRLRVRNKGIFNPRRGIKGDHFVDIVVQLPRALTPRQRELLLEFQQEEERKRGQQAGGGAGAAGGGQQQQQRAQGTGR
ncbi:hypothetical protein HYH02_008545 [Chlamydomonas schloesseri]|uniref:J domain-containing protein n=1 Tax=Chlamydomonas schloesseri TaxID=2026947 RepID=A0A836B3T0_9CHLO|nr:hypothetical protein HYH02_008545 [Chlamydomonas schloesseri]|eukprot:KAG2446558.1 hypothetical protein HYH02_008545 [Chlamydomonas schloesseri]